MRRSGTMSWTQPERMTASGMLAMIADCGASASTRPPQACTARTPCTASPDMPVRMTAMTCEPMAWAADSSMRSIEGTMPVPRSSSRIGGCRRKSGPSR